jgi:NitT/TauT family transport system substrate-binding protein
MKARLATGLLSTAEGLGWIGREAGIFARRGVDFDIVRTETTGPVAVAGLVNGEWDFCDVGAAPIVEANFQGHDTVVVMAAEAYGAVFMVGRRGVDAPEKLRGGRVGVLSRGGQMELSAQVMLDRWRLREAVEIVVLGTIRRVYDALAKGEIDAGMLTADFRFWGEHAHGLHALADIGAEFRHVGPCLAASRRFLRANPEVASAVVQGYVESIRFFKAERDRVIEILGRYLGIPDAPALAAIHAFYSRQFQDDPRPPADGMQHLIDTYAPRYPAAGRRTVADVCDLSWLG